MAVIIAPMERHLAFGMTARRDPDLTELAQLAARIEGIGYHELWANDGGGRSGLATLAASAGGTCVVRALPASDAIGDWIAVAEAATLRA